MPVRRFHSKTRRGCRQCKERKIKCDEAKPVCNSCAKRQSTCSFAAEKSTLLIVGSPYAGSLALRTNNITTSAIGIAHKTAPSHVEEIGMAKTYSLRGDNNDTLRLMHHWMSTCYSISDLTSVSLPFRDTVPALAFEYDFLLSGLLAVTSLHLALLNPSDIHINSAIKHHCKALTQVYPHLTNISSDNVAALFSFSCLIALYSFGFHQIKPPSLDPLEGIFEVFTLMRGIRVIVDKGLQWLLQGPFAESLLPGPVNTNRSLVPKIKAAISALSRRSSELNTDSMSKDTYTAAINLLRQTFLLAAEKPSAKMTVLPFLIMVPDDYMDKLKHRDPMALVILANYGVAFHWLRGYIWLRGWGKEIVDGVRDTVGSEWRPYFEWAIEEVQGHDAVV